jgi:hypothetical protein
MCETRADAPSAPRLSNRLSPVLHIYSHIVATLSLSSLSLHRLNSALILLIVNSSLLDEPSRLHRHFIHSLPPLRSFPPSQCALLGSAPLKLPVPGGSERAASKRADSPRRRRAAAASAALTVAVAAAAAGGRGGRRWRLHRPP